MMSEQATEQRDVDGLADFGVTVEQAAGDWLSAMQHEFGITAEQAAGAFRDIIQFEIDEIFAGDVEAWQRYNAQIITMGEMIAKRVEKERRAAAIRRYIEVFALCVLWALLVSVPLTLGLLLIAGQL